MEELLRTNDPTIIAWSQALLASEDITTFVLDVYTSSVEGSLGILPRRLMVPRADAEAARQLLLAAGVLDG